MNTNHIALNIVTKGLLNISNVTKGLLFQLVLNIPKRHGGGVKDNKNTDLYKPPLYYERDELYKEINNYKEDDIDSIKVYVDWTKKNNVPKRMEAMLLKKYIEAEILNETGKNINVEIIKKPE